MRDYKVVVPSDCCASESDKERRHALAKMRKFLARRHRIVAPRPHAAMTDANLDIAALLLDLSEVVSPLAEILGLQERIALDPPPS